MPIFLVVIIVAGITIAAVPSFKNKFVGYIKQFGPRAFLIFKPTECTKIGSLEVQKQETKQDNNLQAILTLTPKDENGNPVDEAKCSGSITQTICGGDVTPAFIKALEPIRGSLTSIWNDCTKYPYYYNNPKTTEGRFGCGLSGTVAECIANTMNKFCSNDGSAPDGFNSSNGYYSPKVQEDACVCKTAIESYTPPTCSTLNIKGYIPVETAYYYIIKYYKNPSDADPAEIFNSGDETLGNLGYPNNFSADNEYFTFNSDPSGFEPVKDITFKKPWKYEITTYLQTFDTQNGYEFLAGNTVEVVVDDLNLSAKSDKETMEPISDDNSNQENATATITVGYVDKDGKEISTDGQRALIVEKTLLDSENKAIDDLGLEFTPSDSKLSTNENGKLEFKVKTKKNAKEGTLKLKFKDEENGVESEEITITIQTKVQLPQPTIEPISIQHSGENTAINYNTTANADNELYPEDVLRARIHFTPKQNTDFFKIVLQIPENTTIVDKSYGDGTYDGEKKTITWLYNIVTKDTEYSQEFSVKLDQEIPLDKKTINIKAYSKLTLSEEKEENKKYSDEKKIDLWSKVAGTFTGPYSKITDELSDSDNHPVPRASIELVNPDDSIVAGQDLRDDGYNKDKIILTDFDGKFEAKFKREKLTDSNKVKFLVYYRNVINSGKNKLSDTEDKSIDLPQLWGISSNGNLTYFKTQAIDLKDGLQKGETIKQDIKIRETPGLFGGTGNEPAWEYPTDKQDIYQAEEMATNYYYISRAWEFYNDLANQEDLNPQRMDKPFYIKFAKDLTGGWAAYCRADIPAIDYNYTKYYNQLYYKYSSTITLHEFSHFIQWSLYQPYGISYSDHESMLNYINSSRSPYYDINSNHGGYPNDFTNDSLTEGFANFFATYLNNKIKSNERTNWNFDWIEFDGSKISPINSVNSIDYMMLANTNKQNIISHYALPEDWISAFLMSMLLVGSKKDNDDLSSKVSWISKDVPAFTFKNLLKTSTQVVDDNIKSLLQIFSSLQPKTMKDLYDYFRSYSDLDSQMDGDINEIGLNKLKQMYLLYGFFYDENGDWKYEFNGKETIGQAANGAGFTVNQATLTDQYGNYTENNFYIPPRPWRESEIIPTSFIQYNFIGNINDEWRKYHVDVVSELLPEENNYSYDNWTKNSEKMYFEIPVGSKAYITAEGSSNYLTIDSQDYYDVVSSNLNFNYLASKTFNIDGSTPPTVDEIIAKEAEKNKLKPLPITPIANITPTATSTPVSTETPTQEVSAVPAITTPSSTPTPTKDISIPAPILSLTDQDESGKEIPRDNNKMKAGESVSVKVEDLTDAKSVEIFLDGKKIAESPILGENFSFNVTPPGNTMIGTHTIKLLANNGKSAEVKIKITENNWFNKNTGKILLIIALIAAMFCFLIPIIKNNLHAFRFRMK